jgi:signal transduction histidine kinase
VEFAVNSDRSEVTISVKDDGKGFRTDERESGDHPGFGLFGMRERARLLGGQAVLRTEPGAGTKVVITIPIDAKLEASDSGA